MKKFRAFCLFMSFVVLLSLFPVSVQALDGQENASVTSGCHSVDAARTLGTNAKLVETSKAVFVYERNSDTLLYQWNADSIIYPSSMVKIMTALVALENGDPEDIVKVNSRALSYAGIGTVKAGLKSGEEISLEALLYCLMVESANDAATVIAEHIGGSQDAFVDMMNRKAEELGCTGTHYSNAHGLHDENTYTTARDICKILDAALENELFKTIFETATYTVPETNKNPERTIYTTNHMISKESLSWYYDPRVTGGKTGFTDEAGRCLVVSAEKNGMELICIVMGAEGEYEEDGIALKRYGSFEEAAILLDYAFSEFEFKQVLYEDQILRQYPVAGGANGVAVEVTSELSTVLPKGIDPDSFTWTYGQTVTDLKAPVQIGDYISTVQIWYGDVCIAQSDLVAANAVAVWTETEESRRETDTSEDEGGILIAVVIGAIVVVGVLAFLIFFAVKWIRWKAESVRQRRKRDRRRSR